MNCSNFKIQFSAYIDGGMPDDIRAEAENHLKSCPDCAGMLEAYRTGIIAFRNTAEIEPPADMFERVMAEVNGGAQARVVPLRAPVRRNVLAAAAVVMLALMGSLFFTGGERVEVALNPPVDSTMDVVNAEDIIPVVDSKSETVKRPAQKAYLASYNSDEEPSFSYGVSNHPLIVESGVNAVAE
jgi:hypothetical protein